LYFWTFSTAYNKCVLHDAHAGHTQACKTNADKGFLLIEGYNGTWFYRQSVCALNCSRKQGTNAVQMMEGSLKIV